MERQEEREREEWRRLVEAFEWLEDHCWVLPKEEMASEPSKPKGTNQHSDIVTIQAKLPTRSPLTADELRRLMPGVPDPALAALVLRAQLIAHPNHWRPRLVVDNPRGDASSSKLSAHQLREAISLGTQMAKADALLMLKRKAQQLAEHDRRRPRLVIDNTKITPPQV